MTDEAPPPLKSNGQTPEELVRALRALGRADERDLARLARVGARLDAAALASSGASPSWLRSLGGSKLGMTGLIVGLGALGVLGYSLSGSKRAPIAEPPVAAAPSAIAAPEAPVDRAPAAHIPEPSAAASAAPEPTTERPHAPRTSHRVRSGSRQTPSTAPAAESTAPAAESTAPHLEPETTAKAEPEPEAKPVARAQQPMRPLSEAALVHEARKVASDEPEAALRFLAEHAQRFPNGTLVPEREVLAIEVLRRLGRGAEAARRLRAFEQRYPGSIHLRRLVGARD